MLKGLINQLSCLLILLTNISFCFRINPSDLLIRVHLIPFLSSSLDETYIGINANHLVQKVTKSNKSSLKKSNVDNYLINKAFR